MGKISIAKVKSTDNKLLKASHGTRDATTVQALILQLCFFSSHCLYGQRSHIILAIVARKATRSPVE
ncbi:hypothetical protein SKAU_G00340240 [Synaphobranchus kaupii]|uniref:Uncharacterized protein n=1 Tax=Synaphobranchus kaupii TaxID=118154 RepID=A0A9Q1EMX9_SYNKA|nr:hypothetical protein SKAU_G00340240 [Synaphobranchus kaupii]